MTREKEIERAKERQAKQNVARNCEKGGHFKFIGWVNKPSWNAVRLPIGLPKP
jgi:hypothetical protein